MSKYTSEFTGQEIDNSIKYQNGYNYLLNPSFSINQRELTEYSNTDTSTGVYSVDRWLLNTSSTAAQNETTLKWTFTGSITQIVEDYASFKGRKVTASLEWSALTGPATISINDGIQTTSENLDITKSNVTVTHTVSSSATTLKVTISAISITPVYCKLENGEFATMYQPRLYSEELWLCQRYFQRVILDGQVGAFVTATTIQPLIMLPNTIRIQPTINTIRFPLVYGNGTKYNTIQWGFKKLKYNSLSLTLKTGNNDTTLNFSPYCFYYLKNGEIELDAEMYLS